MERKRTIENNLFKKAKTNLLTKTQHPRISDKSVIRHKR